MEIKTIDDVKNSNLFGNSNYDYIIEKSMKALRDNSSQFIGRNMDIGDTPISPISMNDDFTPIILSNIVMQEYKKLITLINNPETAKEYSFVLLGKLVTLDNNQCYFVDRIVDCNSSTDNLSNRETKMDETKLNDAINFGKSNGYNFYSLCHTHPLISDNSKKTTIAEYLPDIVKESEYIREPGLNLSLQDFVSYEALYQYFKSNPNIITCQTVIMFNGEMVIFSKQNNELKRFVIIMDKSGESVYVSSDEDYKKINYELCEKKL